MTPSTATRLAELAEPAAQTILALAGGGCVVVVGAHQLTTLDAAGVAWRTQSRERLTRAVLLAGGRIATLAGRTLAVRAADTGAVVASFALDGIPADIVATADGGAVVAALVGASTQLLRLAAGGQAIAPLDCAARLPAGRGAEPPVLRLCRGDIVLGVAGALHGLAADGTDLWHADRSGFSTGPRDTGALLTTPPLDVGTMPAFVAGFAWATGYGFFCVDLAGRSVHPLMPGELVLHVSAAATIAHTEAGPRLIATGVDRSIAAVDLAGRLCWRREAGCPLVALVPGGPGTVYAIHSPRPSVWPLYRDVYAEPVCFATCLDAASGTAQWTWQAPGPITAAAATGDHLLAVSERQLFAISAKESPSP